MSDTWSYVGKAALGVSLTAGVIWGAIAGYNAIEENSRRKQKYEMDRQHLGKISAVKSEYDAKIQELNKEHIRHLGQLSKQGRLIARDSCLRYGVKDEVKRVDYSNVNFTVETLSGDEACKDVTFTVNWRKGQDGKKKTLDQLAMQDLNHKAVFENDKVNLFQREAASWKVYQRK